MASIYRRRKKGPYYITYFVRPGVRKTLKGCKDKAATEAVARKLEGDAMLRREGVIDPKNDRYAAAEAKPLKDHLADLVVVLKAKAVTVKQAETVEARVTHILALCKAEHVSQISPSAVQRALGTIREAGASKRSRKRGASLQTCNHYLRAIKQFTRWLWRDGRAREDQLTHLSGFNVQLDRRHDRRALTDDELAWLIQGAEQGPAAYGMTGPNRAILYEVAVGTGFRANELRNLVPESFDLDTDPPTVTVEAAYSKHRRKDVQPIRRDLADALRPWLAGKPSAQPVFCIPHDAAKMLRADLNAAREGWLKEARSPEERKEWDESDFLAYRNSAGDVADFHALRHTYVSRLVRSGANIKVAQELARHSTPTLTLGRYAHMEIVDRQRALDALPSLEHAPVRQEAARATGTDHATAAQARSAIAARRTPEASQPGMSRQDEPEDDAAEEGDVTLATGRTCGHLSTDGKNWRRGRDSNPGSGGYPRQRFSKPSLSAAQPPLRRKISHDADRSTYERRLKRRRRSEESLTTTGGWVILSLSDPRARVAVRSAVMFMPRPRTKRRWKPAKPYLSFPFTPHNNGQWCKKIRGKLHFFGVWEDTDAALEKYLRVATDLHAGREPRSPTLSADAVTVKQICNHYLTYQHRRSQSGEIGPRWFEDCRTVLESLASFVGPGRLASDVSPDDSLRYRQKFARTGLGGRNPLGVHALTRAITGRTRSR